MIFFIGFMIVGKIVVCVVVENLMLTVFELGGKNFVVVIDCADFNIVVK